MRDTTERADTIRLDPTRLGALIGGLVAFVVVGAIVDVLWVLVGAVLGGAIGYAVRRFAGRARTYAVAVDLEDSMSRDQLYREAQELGIDGRASMDRSELAAA